MRCQDILPHLAAGRKVRRASGAAVYVLSDGMLNLFYDSGVLDPSRSADLLATDWELVEEPQAQASGLRHDCGEKCMACAQVTFSDATITRLQSEHQAFVTKTREHELQHEAEFARLTRERDDAKKMADWALAEAGRSKGEVTRLTRELAEARARFAGSMTHEEWKGMAKRLEGERNDAVLQVNRLTRELTEARGRYVTLHDAVVAEVNP